MKKAICFLLISILVTGMFSNAVLADDINLNNYLTESEIREMYYSSPEYLAHLQESPEDARDMLDEIIEDYFYTNSDTSGSGSSLPLADDTVSQAWVSMTLLQQSYNNYCGPASALMAINAWGGSVSGSTNLTKQNTLASLMGISAGGDGAYVYKVRNTLNNYTSYNTYNYFLGSSLSQYSFKMYVYNSLAHDRAPILHAVTNYLSYYNGNVFYHYIPISRVNTSTNTMTLYDPHYNGSYYGIHSVSVYDAYRSISAVSNRYLIANY